MRGNIRERILRILLNSEELSKREISKRADCNRAWATQFLKKLEEKKLVKGTKVLNKKKLIGYWLSIHKKPKKYKVYMVKEPLKLLKKMKLEYVLTTYQAENLIQKHLFPSRTDIYVREEDLVKWHEKMLQNGLYGSGNVRVIVADEHIFYGKQKKGGLFTVSAPQLIIDLLSEGGVCAEAGEMLLKNVLKNS
jgi:DNA-binding Lrp family transcriptional regulator